jgi:thioredoxin 1
MSGSGDIIEFNGDRNSFKSTLKQHSKKTIFVKYYATWCGPCKQIHDLVLSQYKKYDKEKLLLLVNVDECADVASAMKIRSLPTIQTYKNGYPDQVVIGSNTKSIENLFSKK